MRTLLVWLMMVGFAHAEPIAISTLGNVTVTLTDEACELPAVVNLRNRVTWKEGNHVYEGCWGMNQLGIVIMYFDDKTAVGIPGQIFRAMHGA